MRRVAGELRLRLRGDVGEGGDVDQRRDDRHALLGEAREVPRQQAGGVLDAVDPGVEHVVERVLGEAVRGDAGAFLVGGGDRRLERRPRASGGEVAGVAVDPVPDEFDPAVAARACLRTASARSPGSTSWAKPRR